MLCVHVVVKTINFEISRCHFVENATKVRAARAARLFFLIQPIRSLFSGAVVAIAVVFAL